MGPLTYDELVASFRWELPARINLGVDAVDRQPPGADAILVSDGREITRRVTFGELSGDSNRLANALGALGVGGGDRVGIVLSQRPETAVAHVAAAKLGAVALPLSTAFGPEALQTRLTGAEPRVVVAEGDAVERVRSLAPDGVRVLDADRELPGLLARASPVLRPADTGPDTPALLVYTSGTTGPPKGALHGHRVLAGHLPQFRLSHDFYPQPGDLIWTPADWAWIGALYDVLLPSLACGRPVLAWRPQRFDPERALDAMARLGVRNVFMPATALRLLRGAAGPPVRLRTLASGGETVGAETAAWCEERFGTRLNEFYGQTEANLLVGNCGAWPARPGSMGRAYPGHEVRVVDGEVVLRVAGDPVVFLGYWRDEAATAAKVRDGWLHTGDTAELDEDGYLWFVGRDDDLISSAGYRIGPGEIEECLVGHPAVTLAAAIGVPDDLRGAVVKAFVVPAPGAAPSAALAEELRAHVRERLAPYQTPREVAFVDDLPLTVTGKIRRGELRRREASAPGA